MFLFMAINPMSFLLDGNQTDAFFLLLMTIKPMFFLLIARPLMVFSINDIYTYVFQFMEIKPMSFFSIHGN